MLIQGHQGSLVSNASPTGGVKFASDKARKYAPLRNASLFVSERSVAERVPENDYWSEKRSDALGNYT